MPRGVSHQFLNILHNERRARVRTAAWMAGLVLPAYVIAELTDGPLLGAVVQAWAAALVLGLVGGALLAWRRTRRYNESLVRSWNAWMRMSLSCARLDEVARHVQNAPRRVAAASVAWSALFLANALLFAALWSEWAWATLWGVPVTAVNGLVVGGLVADSLWGLGWTARFRRALDELLAEGKVGLWGEV